MGWFDRLAPVVGIFWPVRFAFRKMKYVAGGEKIRFYSRTQVFNCSFGGYNALRQGVRLSDSTLGTGTYINERSEILGAKIGNYCSIGEGVKIGFGSHPMGQRVSTSGLFLMNTKAYLGFTIHEGSPTAEMYKKTASGYIAEIGHDVWIGSGAKILDGITVGHGAVIGAGAVVTHDIEPYAVVGGVPARLIRKRFTGEQIRFLEWFRWWDRGMEWVKAHYREMDDMETFMQNHLNDEPARTDME